MLNATVPAPAIADAAATLARASQVAAEIPVRPTMTREHHGQHPARVALLLGLASMIAVSQVLSLYATREPDLRTFDDARFVAFLDARIPELMKDHAIPGVGVLLIKDGRQVWSSAYGYADQATGRPLLTESIMMTHSISKSVTAWGVMKLVQEGRIGLDDPVGKHLRS